MRLFALLSILVITTATLNAQTDTSIFNAMQKEESAEYVLSIPNLWHFQAGMDASSKDRRFEFTGIALPAEFNHTPVTAIFTLRKLDAKTLKEAEDYVLNEFTNFPDRITQSGYNYDRDTLTIASGEKAQIISTHYYRRTKASNYSRYYLFVYSEKRKASYVLTATFQYRDFNYTLPTSAGFKPYMYRIFKTLVLR